MHGGALLPPIALPSPRRGRAVLAALAVALVALAALAPAAFADPQYRGLNLHSMWGDQNASTIQNELDMSKDLGANVIRVDVGWSSLETNGKGQISQWYVDRLDSVIHGASARGIKTIVTLMYTPCWASSAPASLKQNCSGSWWDRGVQSYPPTNPQDYADIARWVTSRYGDQLAALEVWNEPDPSQSFLTSSDPAGDYVKLVKAA